jgi:hypothetical protein
MNEQMLIVQKLYPPFWIVVFSPPVDLTSDVLISDLF